MAQTTPEVGDSVSYTDKDGAEQSGEIAQIHHAMKEGPGDTGATRHFVSLKGADGAQFNCTIGDDGSGGFKSL